MNETTGLFYQLTRDASLTRLMYSNVYTSTAAFLSNRRP
jgi:hypothetical protein